jgi:uncharacterized protein
MRRRRVRRSSPFGWIALVLALPAIAAGLWFGWQFLETWETADVSTSIPGREAPSPPGLDLTGALVSAGVEPLRIHQKRDVTEVETHVDAAELARALRQHLPGLEIVTAGNRIDVRQGEETRSIVIRPLATTDSGAGLIEVEAAPSFSGTAPARPPTAGRKIAIILDDVGFERQPLEKWAELGVPVTFAVIPFTPRATWAANLLNERGFEIIVHLPMEPNGYPRFDPGEGAVLASMDDQEIQRLTLSALRSVPNARGMNNHMGSRATADRRVMASVLAAVRENGGFYIDSRTTAASVGETMARELKIRSASRNVFLDGETTEAAVRQKIDELAAVADRDGIAIGIGHVYPVTLRVLQEEIPRLVAAGYEFIPASAAVW